VAEQSKIKIVACPHCGAAVEWIAENSFRPFCSERCRLIDLGAWASEQFRIATPEPTQSSEDEE
jgi:endogenous inhibitor of DNA gyrase (YacG/DUF329 family)